MHHFAASSLALVTHSMFAFSFGHEKGIKKYMCEGDVHVIERAKLAT